MLYRSFALALCVLALRAHASIRIAITGGPLNGQTYAVAAGQNLVFPTAGVLPDIDEAVTMIRIYADDPLSESIGNIVINSGRAGSVKLRVLISTQESFPESPQDPFFEAGVFEGAGITLSDSLRQKTTVAAGYVGSQSGSIDVGQAFLILAAGSIAGPITGRAPNDSLEPVPTIAFVQGASISGAISAVMDPNNSGAIGGIRLVRGGSPSGTGITGAVLAAQGKIETIVSLAGIGPADGQPPVSIHAGKGIGSIEATRINADIRANLNAAGEQEGHIKRITTTSAAGHFSGAMNAIDLEADATGTRPIGLDVRGNLNAAVTLTRDLRQRIRVRGATNGTISIGRHALRRIESHEGFSAPITIGGDLRASLIAGQELASSETADPGIPNQYKYGRNMASLVVTGDIVCPEAAGTAPVIAGFALSSIEVCARQGTIANIAAGGMVPSTGDGRVCIFANSIGSITATRDCFVNISTGFGPNGRETYSDSPVALGSLSMGGRLGGMQSFSTISSGVNVAKSLASRFVLASGLSPPLANTEGDPFTRVRIGDGFVGRVEVHGNAGLNGLAVFNSLHQKAADTYGMFSISKSAASIAEGRCTGGPVARQTHDVWFNDPVAGLYGPTGAAIGGANPGSIGTIPFGLHVADCFPSAAAGFTTPAELVVTRFDGRVLPHSGVVLTFNGPIWTDMPGVEDSPIELVFRRFVQGYPVEETMDPSSYRVILTRGTQNGATRLMEVRGNGTYRFAPGLYRIIFREDGPAPYLFCGAAFNGQFEFIPVRPFVYEFNLDVDCDGDGFPNPPGACACSGNCNAADFNDDGGVDGSDIGPFFEAWANAAPGADVNMDGGIDGADVEAFFCWWEDGGC